VPALIQIYLHKYNIPTQIQYTYTNAVQIQYIATTHYTYTIQYKYNILTQTQYTYTNTIQYSIPIQIQRNIPTQIQYTHTHTHTHTRFRTASRHFTSLHTTLHFTSLHLFTHYPSLHLFTHYTSRHITSLIYTQHFTSFHLYTLICTYLFLPYAWCYAVNRTFHQPGWTAGTSWRREPCDPMCKAAYDSNCGCLLERTEGTLRKTTGPKSDNRSAYTPSLSHTNWIIPRSETLHFMQPRSLIPCYFFCCSSFVTLS
jgi:hypothetical protein